MPDDKPSLNWNPEDWRKGGDPFRHQDWKDHGDWRHGGKWNDNKFKIHNHLDKHRQIDLHFHPPKKQDK